MGSSLHLLLQNIHKLPVPPPVNNLYNPDISKPKQYWEILINYLIKIKDVNEFVGSDKIFYRSMTTLLLLVVVVLVVIVVIVAEARLH